MFLYHYNENTGTSDLLEETFIKLPPVDEYTYFEIDVNYFLLPEPDTLNIAFASSNLTEYQTYIGLGSTLYIDDLNITYKPNLVGIEQRKGEITHQIYPNPASDKIYIEFQERLKNDISIQVINSKGVLVYHQKTNPLASKQLVIYVKDFAPGLYFYTIASGSSTYTGKFIVQ